MIVTLTARCRALLKKVVKLKTYMLILNCCINVLSHRNRFEYRTTVFIEYFWSWIQKRSIGSANERKIDLDSYDNFRLFHTFSNVMSRNLLVPYPDRAKAIKKKIKISPKTFVDCTFRVDVSQWWKAKFLNRVPTWNV